MKNLVPAALALGVSLTAFPAQALEHRIALDHPDGPITADYRGAVSLETRQTGSAGPGGRAATLRCDWSVSLSVERTAIRGTALTARRSMTREGALKGSAPGWCSKSRDGIERIVEACRDSLREAMMAIVAQDRDAILVDADDARQRTRTDKEA